MNKNKFFTVLSSLLLLLAFALKGYAQPNVLNPNDPEIIHTATNQPAQPAWNNYNIVKWGHTKRLSWNPYAKGYRSYYFQNMAFRIKFPKTYVHNVADGKKYPMLIFFHGRGEAGTIYDNEYQLLHGGELHANKVNDGTFDGFLLYAQSTSGNSQDYFPRISSLIDSLIKYVKVDADRVMLNGLSAGGQSSWEFVGNANYARKVAATLPMCAAKNEYTQTINNYLTSPVWVGYGGLDPAPAPGIVESSISNDVKLERNTTAGNVSTSGTESKLKESGSKKSASNSNKAKFEIDQHVLGHSQKYNQLFDAKVFRKRYDQRTL
jgi:hypothetical protein